MFKIQREDKIRAVTSKGYENHWKDLGFQIIEEFNTCEQKSFDLKEFVREFKGTAPENWTRANMTTFAKHHGISIEGYSDEGIREVIEDFIYE